MMLHELLAGTVSALKKHRCAGTNPGREAEELVAWATGTDRVRMISHPELLVRAASVRKVRAAVAARLKHSPIEHIVGSAGFFGRDFLVTPATLIPRPATETVVEAALFEAARMGARRIVDVGTGSGAIAVTSALELPDAEVFATDISARALAVARKNAARHGVAERVRFAKADLLPARCAWFGGDVPTVVIANLPYVPEAKRRSMAREVVRHEPASALFSGHGGLEHMERLLVRIAGHCAASNGDSALAVCLEMLPGQCARMERFAKRVFTNSAITRISNTQDTEVGIIIRTK